MSVEVQLVQVSVLDYNKIIQESHSSYLSLNKNYVPNGDYIELFLTEEELFSIKNYLEQDISTCTKNHKEVI